MKKRVETQDIRIDLHFTHLPTELVYPSTRINVCPLLLLRQVKAQASSPVSEPVAV